MGLKEVKEEILSKAQKEAAAILAEAEKERASILKEAEAKALEQREKTEESTKRLLETMERRELAQAEFDVRKAILDKKKDIIDSVMASVKKRLSELPAKKRAAYIQSLIEKARREIDVGVVVANPRDKGAVQVTGVEFRPKEDMLGGIIARTKDGTVSVDYSYDEILVDIQEKSLQELGKALFKH